MGKISDSLRWAMDAISGRIPFMPKVALVLGSGLGAIVDSMDVRAVISFEEIPGLPCPTSKGHEACFVFGYMDQVPVVCMKGRLHYYEGFSMDQVVMPIRLMKRMGAGILVLTNVAGGIREDLCPGTLMVVQDQIASFVPSPLIGPNEDSLGPRFPDMNIIYRRELRAVLHQAAADLGIPLKDGVYIQMPGPNFETPAEINMCRILGADAVGMTLASDAIAANHMGMRVCGISLITNYACGITPNSLSHEEVGIRARESSGEFGALLNKAISYMKEL